ncbi:tripartite tricarboxylate transporter TctB family protein [Pseudorhizobium flavum]|jgi:putative tricarboxylic transport membrane protein|uniref:tripartite tricarboxylate transporter TctB family protein n=1 Tax=Pseudorhizobium flavum TaxID=1335061 RepID=UPI0024910035|nr:tripartite tricarboxylate transporter TctB family protein [Pseudorhizobium flavum]
MRFSDTTLGAIFLLAGISLAWYSFNLPAIPGQNYGAATFPLLIAMGLIGCSARLLYTGISQGNQPLMSLSDEVRNPRRLAGVVATLLLVLFYILFVQILGFIPTAIIITLSMFLILKVRPAKAVILAILAAFACDFIFRTMLLVPLPFGIVPRLPW